MEIAPDKQNVEKVFSGINYYIDFYQREYKWSEANINSLLDDIFYKFNQDYEKNQEIEANEKNITENYSWYYLNTYITNQSEGKHYIVDGQQRLTTLTLILIKLYHLCNENHFNSNHREWLKTKITGYSAKGENFWMGDKRTKVLSDLFSDDNDLTKIDTSEGKSAEAILINYKRISNFIDAEINTLHKFDAFILYFLKRVVLINLEVEQTDVPMVFEVINDRGERLKPYEILKGKLLGQIHKSEVDYYNQFWEEKIKILQNYDDADDFFRTYLKAKYATTRAKGRDFDGDYHKIIFSNDFSQYLNLKRNPKRVKIFIENEFRYYLSLYFKVKWFNALNNNFDKNPHVFFNDLIKQDSQIMLIIAACGLDDEHETEKIYKVSKLLEKTYVLLQLNKSYDSNKFMEIAYELNGKLIDADINDYEEIFNRILLRTINEKHNSSLISPFHYNFFRELGYQDFNTNFLRFFFARIEYYLSKSTNRQMQDTFDNYVRNTGKVNGYHVEHILADNPENLALFDNNEEIFIKERNRLGGLLLLKGKDNQSSGAEKYSEKLKTYIGTNYWNQTLHSDFYKSNIDFKKFIEQSKLPFKPIENFNIEAIESRSKLLFEIVKNIWN